MDVTLEQLLQRAVEANASDIHLKVGAPPVMRIGGELRRMENLPPLKPADTAGYAQSIFTQKAAIEFKEYSEADFAYGRQDLGRFRVSAFRQRGSVSMVLRRVTPGVPAMDRLGLPPVVRKLAAESKGLVLVTGPSGSGRTTTLASIIEHINATRPVSIVTIEDPIEILHFDKRAMINQREVRVDTTDFSTALRAAMPVKPGVEARVLGQHVGREEVLSRGEAARAAVLQTDLHFAAQDEDPLRPGGAVEFGGESDGAFAQLIPGGRQHGREPRLRRALRERHALLAEFCPAVLIRVQDDLGERRFAVHYLLLFQGHNPWR